MISDQGLGRESGSSSTTRNVRSGTQLRYQRAESESPSHTHGLTDPFVPYLGDKYLLLNQLLSLLNYLLPPIDPDSQTSGFLSIPSVALILNDLSYKGYSVSLMSSFPATFPSTPIQPSTLTESPGNPPLPGTAPALKP